MLTNFKRLALVAMLAVAGFLAANSAANAQFCHCTIVNGCKVLTYYDSLGNPTGTETICPSSGTGNFNCQQLELPPNGPLNLTLPPASIDAQGNSPTLGPVITRFDPTRPSTPATIKSNFPPRRFPATVRFSFYARSTIQNVEYCSRTQLVFFNGNVFSFQPFNNEQFCLESDVQFYRCSDPQQRTAFVIRAGQTCVTLN